VATRGRTTIAPMDRASVSRRRWNRDHWECTGIISFTKYTIVNILFVIVRVHNTIGRAMARVPITIMGYRCERCGHEWIPRGNSEVEPRVCPKCRSPWWNKPKKSMMPYEDFKRKIARALRNAAVPLTWTEVRTTAGLPQLFPNNQWVHRLEKDIGLHRKRDPQGIIHWQLKEEPIHDKATTTAQKQRSKTRRK
jgi:predicted Zn-ribbon and HTH transcriptional regulator